MASLLSFPVETRMGDKNMTTFTLHFKEVDGLTKGLCLPKRDFSLPDIPSRSSV